MELEMSPIDVGLLQKLGVADTQVTLRLSRLTTASRKRAVRYLRSGWIRTSDKGGVGLLLSKLGSIYPLPWHLRGAAKYGYVFWYHCSPPEEVRVALEDLVTADKTASLLQGLPLRTGYAQHQFQVLNYAEMIPPILEPWVEHISYQRAVLPLASLIERGEDIAVIQRPMKYRPFSKVHE